jgi:hypothetical protein
LLIQTGPPEASQYPWRPLPTAWLLKASAADAIQRGKDNDVLGIANLPGTIVGAANNGIFLSDFERGEIGPDLFRHACLMGLEGLVSKHSDRTYRAGVSLVIAGQ